ncbi:Activating signal cointegrator 1 complex subunit 3, partial [Operophtera brumata]
FKSLADIQNYIKHNEDNPSELLNLLKQLKESCKALTGEQSDEVIEDAAVLCLRMFLDQDIVMLKHLSQLRQLFGMVQSSTVNNICDEYIKRETSDSNKENVKLWGDHIQCHCIPYKPAKKPLANLRVRQATACAFVNDFSMKYNEQAYGKTWLETKVNELYVTSGISSADILQSIITFLNSPRTNDDLQNDMFELLGFDKFEFIQEMLVHRQEITNNLRAPPVDPGPSIAEMSVQSEGERMLAKLVRKEEKKNKNKRIDESEVEPEINIAQLRAKRLAELSKPVVPFSATRSQNNIDPVLQKISYFQTKVQYPNVFDSSLDAKNS